MAYFCLSQAGFSTKFKATFRKVDKIQWIQHAAIRI